MIEVPTEMFQESEQLNMWICAQKIGRIMPTWKEHMMKRGSHQKHVPACKSNVAFVAVIRKPTMAELAGWFDGHPNQKIQWKNFRLERTTDAFAAGDSTLEPPIWREGPARQYEQVDLK